MPYRLGKKGNGGGVIIHVREDILSKVLRKHLFPTDQKGIC